MSFLRGFDMSDDSNTILIHHHMGNLLIIFEEII